MTPQELKNSILQLAIQGKLVEQRPDEGTATELYRQIQAEKRRLIKEGTVKNQVPSPDILEGENPFDIPESWMWCRITECGFFVSGYTPKPSQLTNSGSIPYFKVSDMNTKGNELWLSITSNYLKSSNTCKTYPINTIVYPKNGGAVFTNKKRILAQKSVIDLNTGGYYPFEPLSLSYIYLFLSTIDFRFYYKGTALPTLDMGKLATILIPLPPFAEQKRIVAKVEELLPYIDRYERAWSKLEEFNKRFPGDMQKSILQMAIQGKLVEQRPEEGTGEELYRQIQAEKQKLIKAGKIKKEKPLPEISEEEKPFDIPESWKWIRLDNIARIQSSKRVFEDDYVPSGIPFFRSKEIGNLSRGEDIQTELFITREHFEKIKELYGVPKSGDLLLTSVGTIGNVWICDGREFYYKDGNVTQICSSCYYDSKFIEHFLHSPWFEIQVNSTVSGTAYSALTLIKLKKIIMPLPPLEEQKRIVSKLEEILPLCDKLK